MYTNGSEAPWTIARAQAAIGEVAYQLLALVDALDAIKAALPLPADLAERQEHRMPYDVATDLDGTCECATDNLREVIESLQRSAQVTDEELAEDFRQWRARHERN